MRLDSVYGLKRELRGSVNEVAGFGDIRLGSYSPPSPLQFGIALGVALGPGPQDYRLAVRLTRYGQPVEQYVNTLARQARGEIEVQRVGVIQAPRPLPASSQSPWRLRARPLRPGYSIAHASVTAGTIGGLVEREDGTRMILSNNHVLANSDRGRPGELIFQPGPMDGGAGPWDLVGRLHGYVPLSAEQNVDVALATPNMGVGYEPIYANRRLTGTAPAVLNSPVWKVGRTTGVTVGYVRAISVDDVPVDFHGETIYFDDQIEIEGANGPFSLGGDSGSLIIDSGFKGVGLLFAGSSTGGIAGWGRTYANPLGRVLQLCKAKLLI